MFKWVNNLSCCTALYRKAVVSTSVTRLSVFKFESVEDPHDFQKQINSCFNLFSHQTNFWQQIAGLAIILAAFA